MRSPDCSALAELQSAFVDGALEDDDRERVLRHLAGCGDCRREVEELRSVRGLLRRYGSTPEGPGDGGDLSSRLVSIAGDDAYAPVWSRPFRRTPAGTLPRTPSATGRIAAAVLAVGALVGGAGALGWAAAPTAAPGVVADPTALVRSEFAATLSQSALTGESLPALLMAPSTAVVAAPDPVRPLSAPASGRRLDSAGAAGVLERVALGAPSVSYTGEQRVAAARDQGSLHGSVRVSYQLGQGTDVRVLSATVARAGRLEAFIAPVTSRTLDDELLTQLLQDYRLSGRAGATVAGRAATVVEAVAVTSVPSAAGPVAARWWVDDVTGLLLWHEAYGSAGQVTTSAGFTRLRVGTSPGFLEHLPPRLAVSTATAAMALSTGAGLAGSGWFCADDLAGLALVQLRGDRSSQPGVLHLVYGDGVTTTGVLEQHGTLGAAPAGARWDGALGAFVQDGLVPVATWQSGSTVFSVVSDGPATGLARVVRAMPHEAAPDPTTMERVRAGWAHLLELVSG